MTGRRGRMEGSIYQRADGLWVGAVHLGYGVDSKRVRKVVRRRTRREVQEKVQDLLRAAKSGVPVPPARLTVAAFLDRWLKDAVKPHVRPRTFESYDQIVKLYLKPALGRIMLAKLSTEDVDRMLAARLASGLSPRTVHHARAVLRNALNRAARWGLVTRNAAALARPPRVAQREVHPLTPEQARQLLVAVQDDRLGPLFTLALALGMRQGELLGLTWDSVDLTAATVSVRVALQRVDGQFRLVEPKTARSHRNLPLPEVAVAALKTQRAQQNQERLRADPRWQDKFGLVFTTTVGTPMDGVRVTRRLHEILAAIGLPQQTFHDLRHGRASLQLAMGIPARVVMENLGHSDIRLTMNTYSHVFSELQRDAASRMDHLLGPAAQREPDAVATPVATPGREGRSSRAR